MTSRPQATNVSLACDEGLKGDCVGKPLAESIRIGPEMQGNDICAGGEGGSLDKVHQLYKRPFLSSWELMKPCQSQGTEERTEEKAPRGTE